MNRREALAALVSMPEIARISAAPVGPTDVIVVETEMEFSDEVHARMKATLESVWPGRKIVVLSKGITLKVVAGTPTA